MNKRKFEDEELEKEIDEIVEDDWEPEEIDFDKKWNDIDN